MVLLSPKDRRRPPGTRRFLTSRPIGAGLVIIGAALGIGGLGRAAVESMARQPEIAGNIQTAMIIAAALIEGVTFFACIICSRSSSADRRPMEQDSRGRPARACWLTLPWPNGWRVLRADD